LPIQPKIYQVVNKMIEKLEELRRRTENLIHMDKNELDDIQRKAKLYLEQLFPNKFTYLGEVDKITFFPSFWVDGMGNQPYIDSWNKGKGQLLNLLDTRIEEAKLLTSNPKDDNVKIVEKVIQIVDNTRIEELKQELDALKGSKNLWNRINYLGLGTIILTLISGSFFLGKYFGENKFDQQKIDLLFENQELLRKQDSLTMKVELVKSDSLNKDK
jgi:hypothetical protein